MPRRTYEVNPIDVVELAYDIGADDKTWLTQLATVLRPLLDTGRGYFAYRFDLRTPLPSWYEDALFYDVDRTLVPELNRLQLRNPDLVKIAHFNFEGLLGLTELGIKAGLGDIRHRTSVAELFELMGVEDMAALQTVEPGGKGVVFAAGQSAVRHWDSRARRLWARVNAHIAAARRLREAIAAQAAGEEAVLDARGMLHHAEGDARTTTARDVLREAVRRVEKARGTMRRRDPDGATDAWTALVSGRWSLVDRYERDGRRYIIARRNEHALPDPRALTGRERAIAHLAALGKPNKLIGYELGLSESTVASHLSRIMRKLGARSRVQLIGLLAALSPSPDS